MTQVVTDNTLPDAELVRVACTGEPEAYAELVCRWSARVLAVCHARVRRRDVAEELAQEAFLRGFQSLSTLDSPERFGPWLRGIAQRVCLDWLKAKQTGQVTFTELPPDNQPDGFLVATSDNGGIDRADELRHLMTVVEQLPDECREVVMLYYYNDLTYRDLAEMLEVSAATINARLTKARSLLREQLSTSRRSGDEL